MTCNIRAGFVSVVGYPNVGKSTLVNCLVGEKISIVSAKPQTTRQRIFGILTQENFQIVFTDLPGATQRPGEINEFIRSEIQRGLEGCDGILLVDDLTAPPSEKIFETLKLVNFIKPLVVVINKVDLATAEKLAQRINFWESNGLKAFGFSALKPQKVPQQVLLEQLVDMLPLSPSLLYDPELYTTQNLRDMACEIVREKCFELLHKEVPYGLAVRCLKFEEPLENGFYRIYMEILVSKENHKPIVIGTQGKTLRQMGQMARQDLEKLLNHKTYLNLYVRVSPQWSKDRKILKELGYVSQH